MRDALDLRMELIGETLDGGEGRGEIGREHGARAAFLEGAHERREIAAIGKVAVHEDDGDAAARLRRRIGPQAPALPRHEAEVVEDDRAPFGCDEARDSHRSQRIAARAAPAEKRGGAGGADHRKPAANGARGRRGDDRGNAPAERHAQPNAGDGISQELEEKEQGVEEK